MGRKPVAASWNSRTNTAPPGDPWLSPRSSARARIGPHEVGERGHRCPFFQTAAKPRGSRSTETSRSRTSSSTLRSKKGSVTRPLDPGMGESQSMSNVRAHADARPHVRVSHQAAFSGAVAIWLGTWSRIAPRPCRRSAERRSFHPAIPPNSGFTRDGSTTSYPCALPGRAVRTGER